MSNQKTSQSRLEISRGIKDGKAGIDREYEDEKFKGVIRGFAVMTKGNVKDMREWEIDDDTLEGIEAAGNKPKMGLKSRFGHPNMSSTALGTFLGRAKNFYRDDDIVRADLYLSKTAYKTPDGDLASYVLDLAEKDPDAFGTSVVLGEWDLEYRIDKKGVRQKDKNGKELPPMLRVGSLLAVDAVDDPAANDGMFNRFFNDSVELSAKASEFLNKLLDNPEALDYVISFLERYKKNRADIDVEVVQAKPETSQEKPKQEERAMDLKDLTVEQLKSARPDLFSSIHDPAKQSGINEERKRALDIVKASNSEFKGMGMEPLVEESIEKGHTLEASLASMRKKRLDDLNAQSNKDAGADEDKTGGTKSHVERAKEYKAEHKCSMTEALRATATPRNK